MGPRPLIAAIALVLATACASTTRPGSVGVDRQQLLLASAEQVERMALVSYAQQYRLATDRGVLIPSGPEFARLREIKNRLIPQTTAFRDDAVRWRWDLTLIDAPILNATCAPGGKITFFTGLVRQLQLTDSEIAAVMSHEIAHALREHGREKVSQALAQNLISNVALAATNNKQLEINAANQVAHYLFVLPNSRQNENEADRIGLELMARSGYDPRADVSVWEKLDAVSRGRAMPEFLSTHPSNANRIREIQALLPIVIPIYEVAPKP